VRLGPQTAFRLLREWQGSGFIDDMAEQGSGQTEQLTANQVSRVGRMS
jgi:hypothetical protein